MNTTNAKTARAKSGATWATIRAKSLERRAAGITPTPRPNEKPRRIPFRQWALERYKAKKVLDFLAECERDADLAMAGRNPLSAPQNDTERELDIRQLAELRCRQKGWQSVEKVWEYYVLDLEGDFPWTELENEPSAFPPGFRPKANFLSEMERLRIAYRLGTPDEQDAIMAHLAGFKTEFDSY